MALHDSRISSVPTSDDFPTLKSKWVIKQRTSGNGLDSLAHVPDESMLTTSWVDMYPSLPSHNGKSHLLHSKSKADIDLPSTKGVCDLLTIPGLGYESIPIASADGELGCLLETPIAAETDAGTASMFMREDEMEAWLMDSLKDMNGQDCDLLPQAWQSTEAAVTSAADVGKHVANAAVGAASQNCVVTEPAHRHQQIFDNCEARSSKDTSADKTVELPIQGRQCSESHPAPPTVQPTANDLAAVTTGTRVTDSCASQSKARSQAIMRLKEHLMKLEQQQTEEENQLEHTKQQQPRQRTRDDSPSHLPNLPLQSQSQPLDHAWQVIGACRGTSPPSAANRMHSTNGECNVNGAKVAATPAARPGAAASGNKPAAKTHPLNFSHFSRPAAMFARGRAACGLSSATRTPGSPPANNVCAAATNAPADPQLRNTAPKQVLHSARTIPAATRSPSDSNGNDRNGNGSGSGVTHQPYPSTPSTVQLQGCSSSLSNCALPGPSPSHPVSHSADLQRHPSACQSRPQHEPLPQQQQLEGGASSTVRDSSPFRSHSHSPPVAARHSSGPILSSIPRRPHGGDDSSDAAPVSVPSAQREVQPPLSLPSQFLIAGAVFKPPTSASRGAAAAATAADPASTSRSGYSVEGRMEISTAHGTRVGGPHSPGTDATAAGAGGASGLNRPLSRGGSRANDSRSLPPPSSSVPHPRPSLLSSYTYKPMSVSTTLQGQGQGIAQDSQGSAGTDSAAPSVDPRRSHLPAHSYYPGHRPACESGSRAETEAVPRGSSGRGMSVASSVQHSMVVSQSNYNRMECVEEVKEGNDRHCRPFDEGVADCSIDGGSEYAGEVRRHSSLNAAAAALSGVSARAVSLRGQEEVMGLPHLQPWRHSYSGAGCGNESMAGSMENTDSGAGVGRIDRATLLVGDHGGGLKRVRCSDMQDMQLLKRHTAMAAAAAAAAGSSLPSTGPAATVTASMMTGDSGACDYDLDGLHSCAPGRTIGALAEAHGKGSGIEGAARPAPSTSVQLSRGEGFGCGMARSSGVTGGSGSGAAAGGQDSETARRARAAEVHNQSERRRRDRINDRMKALQQLIPNSNKTDKASMLDEAIDYLKLLQTQLQVMSSQAGMAVPSSLAPPASSTLHAKQATDYAGIAAADLLHSVLPPSRLHTHGDADSDSLLTTTSTRPLPHCMPQRLPTHPSSSILTPSWVQTASTAMGCSVSAGRVHEYPPSLPTNAGGGSSSRWPFNVDGAVHDGIVSTATPSTARDHMPSKAQEHGSGAAMPVRGRVKAEGSEQANDMFSSMPVAMMMELQQRRRASCSDAAFLDAISQACPSSRLNPEAAAMAAAAAAASMSVPRRSVPALQGAGANLSNLAYVDAVNSGGDRASEADLLSQLQAAREWTSLRAEAGEKGGGLEEEEAALRMMIALEGGNGGTWFDMCGGDNEGSKRGRQQQALQRQQQLLQQRQLMMQQCQEEEHYMRQLRQYKPYEQQELPFDSYDC